MIVGVATWELHLNGCQSLKDKRRVVKSLKDRLHRRFNVSVAETGHQDRWQLAELACCVVATDRRQAQAVLAAVTTAVAEERLVRILDSTTSYL